MAEIPAAQPAPAPDDFVGQRLRLQEKLRAQPEALTGDLKVLHTFLSRGRPKAAPYFPTPAQRETLDKTWSALQAAGHNDPLKMQEMFGQIEQLVTALEQKDGPIAQQKLALLLNLEIVKAAIAHEKAYTAALDANVATLTAYGAIKGDEHAPVLRFLFTDGVPLPPPAGAPPELTKEWEELTADAKAARAALVPGLRQPAPAASPEAGVKLTEFARRYDKYERACMAAGRTLFLKEMGFPPDCTEEELNRFIISLARPIMDPSQAVDEKNRTKPAVLEQYKKLNAVRQEVSNRVALAMRRNLAGEVGKNQVEGITQFLVNRNLYERKVLQRPQSDNDEWLLYMGVVVNEAAEEILEEYISWEAVNKRTLQKIPILRDLPPAARTGVIKGWEQVCAQMGRARVPVETLGKLFSFLNKMPLGGKFWGELLAIESPVTVLLWGLFLHESPNKVKSTMQFASFIMVGKATSKAALAAGQALRAAGILKVAPKNPYALFAIGMVVAIASADTIDKLCTWADKNIPESATKDFVGNLFATLSGDFAIGALEELAEISGVSTVDPDRDFRSYMTRPANLAAPGGMLDGDYFHTIDDWNKRVDQAMADAGGKESSIAIKLMEMRKITNVQEWAKGQSVTLHIHVTSLAAQERELEAALRAAGALGGGETLGGLELATRDGKGFRNDKAVRYAFSGTGKDALNLKKARDHIEGIASKAGGAKNVTDPLYKQFAAYADLLNDTAKDVSLFNHLGVFSREEWLGSLDNYSKDYVEPTEFVRAGLVINIADAMRRNRAVSRASYPGMKDEEYAAELAKALKIQEKVSLIGGLGDDFSALYKEWKGPGIDLMKGAQSLNVPNITIRDELFQLMMQISLTAQDLARSLSPEVANALLADTYTAVQQLVASREMVTSDQLRAIRAKLTEAVLKGKVDTLKAWQADVKDRFETGGAAFLVQGELPGLIDMDAGFYGRRTVDYLASLVSYGYAVRPQLMLLQSRTNTGDLQLFSFVCPSSDRNNWKVQIDSAQRQFYYRGKQQMNSVTHNPSRTISYVDFCKSYPGSAAGVELHLKAIQDARRAEEEAKNTIENKRDEEKAQLKADYIKANEPERMKDLSKVVLKRMTTLKDPRTGEAIMGRDNKPIVYEETLGNAKDLLDMVNKAGPELQKKLEATKVAEWKAKDVLDRVMRLMDYLANDRTIGKEYYDRGLDPRTHTLDLFMKYDSEYRDYAEKYKKATGKDLWEGFGVPTLVKTVIPFLERFTPEEREAARIILSMQNLKKFETMLNEKGAGALKAGLEKEANEHAEKIAGWRYNVRKAAMNDKNLGLVPVAPGSAQMVTIGRLKDPAGEWIILAKPNGYVPGNDASDSNDFSAKTHQPEEGRNHWLRYYRIKTKDVPDAAALNLADPEKNAGVEWLNMSSDMLYSDLGDDWKRLAKHALMADMSGGSSGRLWRMLNLFPYEISWRGNKNAKHKLHDALTALMPYVVNEEKFYGKLLSMLIDLKTGGEGGITWDGLTKIRKSMYSKNDEFDQWGMTNGTFDTRRYAESARQVIVRVFP